MTFLKHECMHRNCLLDKAVDLSTICGGMKCFIFSVELILSCGNSIGTKSNHKEFPSIEEIFVVKKMFVLCRKYLEGLVLPCDKSNIFVAM